MSTYVDTSVVASLLFTESAGLSVSRAMQPLWSECVISDLVSAEVSSAVSRRVRMRLETEAAGDTRLLAWDAFKADVLNSIDIDADDIRLAERLVRIFELKLRTPDAIHISVVLKRGYRLATLDQGMTAAARTLDIDCINPAEASAT